VWGVKKWGGVGWGEKKSGVGWGEKNFSSRVHRNLCFT